MYGIHYHMAVTALMVTMAVAATTTAILMKGHVVKSLEIAERNRFLSVIPSFVRSIGHQM